MYIHTLKNTKGLSQKGHYVKNDSGPFYRLTKSGRIVKLASLAFKNILLTPTDGGGGT